MRFKADIGQVVLTNLYLRLFREPDHAHWRGWLKCETGSKLA